MFCQDLSAPLTYNQLAAAAAADIQELMPWDLDERLRAGEDILIVDVREGHEYDTLHIVDSLHIPRGILEAAAEWGYEETEPALVTARGRTVVLVCRSGQRSAFAAHSLRCQGFTDVWSLKTGLRGWNEYELPLVGQDETPVDIATADAFFATKLLPHQRPPKPS